MTHIFYTCVTYERSDLVFERYLQQLPLEIQYKIKKFKRWQDSHNSLFGKLLLLHALNTLGLGHITLDNLKYSLNQKPYFENGPDFNISHSGKYVICALSNEGNIGIDIEEILPINVEELRQIWTTKEYEQIINDPNIYNKFFELWTKKEAVVKAIGKGLTIPLQEIEVSSNVVLFNEVNWHLKELQIANNYVAHLASKKILLVDSLFKKVEFL